MHAFGYILIALPPVVTMNESKRQRSPPSRRTIIIPSPSPSPTASVVVSRAAPRQSKSRHRKRMRPQPNQRANESPLTFIRSSAHPSRLDVVPAKRGLVEAATGSLEHLLLLCEESIACLNSQSGTLYRTSVYGLLPMLEHEQFDTMAIRRVRTFFSSVPATQTAPPSALPDLTSSTEEDEDDDDGVSGTDDGSSTVSAPLTPMPMVAVPRLDAQAYSERSYVLRLALAEQPVARISIEHTVEELLERCAFLRDPGSTWITRPDRLHVLLATTDHPNVTREERRCRRLIHSLTGPVELKLHRLMWRRQGTLWVQWHCVGGNIDRLRADLRIASGGRIEQVFTGSPEQDPTLSRPFAVETLIMAVLNKPTKDEFLQLKTVTGEMQRMFHGVTATFTNVARVSQIHDRLDRDGVMEDEVIEMGKPKRLPSAHAESFMDRLDLGWDLMRTSPSVGRICAVVASGLLVSSVGALFIIKRFSR